MFCNCMSEGGNIENKSLFSKSGQVWSTEVDNRVDTYSLNTCVNIPRYYKGCVLPSFISHSGDILSHKGRTSSIIEPPSVIHRFFSGAVLPVFKTTSPLGGIFYC